MGKEMISISRIYADTIIQKIALYCSSYNGNDIYYLKEAIMILINLYGETRLIDMMLNDESNNKENVVRIAENWFKPNGMKKKLENISVILEKIHSSYSILEDKTIPKKQRDKIRFKDFLKQSIQFPKIEMDFYALFVFLIQNCTISGMNISQQYLKVLDQGKRTFGGIDKEKVR
jgi:hypothetical protein